MRALTASELKDATTNQAVSNDNNDEDAAELDDEDPQFNARVAAAISDTRVVGITKDKHAFVQQVAQRYRQNREKSTSASSSFDAHLDRSNFVHAAVCFVMKSWPQEDRPFQGDVDKTCAGILPLMEVIFRMPARGPVEGSEEWIKRKLERVDSTVEFRFLDAYPRLMRAYIKKYVCTLDFVFVCTYHFVFVCTDHFVFVCTDHFVFVCTDDCFLSVKPISYCIHIHTPSAGPIVVDPAEEVPATRYNHKNVPKSSLLESTRRLFKSHTNLPFLRTGGVVYAIGKLRCADIFPVKINPDTLPTAISSWNNYDKVIRVFHVHYCYAQGLSRTSDKARVVLVYLKKGVGFMRSKNQPCIRILHKKLTTNRNRFTCAKKIEEKFQEFLHLLRNK